MHPLIFDTKSAEAASSDGYTLCSAARVYTAVVGQANSVLSSYDLNQSGILTTTFDDSFTSDQTGTVTINVAFEIESATISSIDINIDVQFLTCNKITNCKNPACITLSGDTNDLTITGPLATENSYQWTGTILKSFCRDQYSYSPSYSDNTFSVISFESVTNVSTEQKIIFKFNDDDDVTKVPNKTFNLQLQIVDSNSQETIINHNTQKIIYTNRCAGTVFDSVTDPH